MSFRFCLAIFVGSALLFLVEPMCAKMMLPLLGGTPAVWNTCMVFFQAGLLAGYAYAHYLPSWIGPGRHALLHVVLLLVAGLTLPFDVPEAVPSEWYPVFWLLATLAFNFALPFLLVSANAPLLQRWYSQGTASDSGDPYFLYAASNLGSFVGLLSYPLVAEPNLTLPAQQQLWRGGYFVLVGLTTICLPWPESRHVPNVARGSDALLDGANALTWRQRLRWGLLALAPSSLLLSVTTYLTTDIAPVPLLWVLPLAIYLLTYVFAFARLPWIEPVRILRWVPLAVLVAVLVQLSEATEPLLLVVAVHLGVFFWLALACHSQLARDRPTPRRLTEFYLCLAVGGSLGAVFNGLLAPLLFTRLAEYPLMLVLVALLSGRTAAEGLSRRDIFAASALGGVTALLVLMAQRAPIRVTEAGQLGGAVIFAVPLLVTYLGHARPWRFALSVSAVLLAATLYPGIQGVPVYRARSYFGVHLVADRDQMRRLVHGGTVHGMESLMLGQSGIPLTYYYPTGPIGRVMDALEHDARLDRVGLVGLGSGSLAYYARPGQRWTFYEIDPGVIRIARDPQLFTFLQTSRGTITVMEGDGRLQLKATDEKFGMLVLDAFGSDAVPLHLLTAEALEVYRQRMLPGGIIAFHISNRYLDLEPVVANLAHAAEPPMACAIWADRTLTASDRQAGKFPSIWAVLAAEPADLPKSLRIYPWRSARARADLPVWTDHYSNVWQVFRWREAAEP